MTRFSKHLFIILLAYLTLISCQQSRDTYSLYVGTYTQKEGHVDGKAHGIYKINIDPSNKSIQVVDSIGNVTNPSYIFYDIKHKNIIAVNETGSDTQSGWLSLISARKDDFGKIYDTLHTHGIAPCHVTKDHLDGLVYCNYMGGVGFVQVENHEFKDLVFIDLPDTTLSNHPRQEASHPHQSLTLPNGSYTYIADLGMDKIWIVDHNNRHQEHPIPFLKLPLGSGPRHLTYDPNSMTLYILNELSNSLMQAAVNPSNGSLTLMGEPVLVVDTSTDLSSSADVHLCTDHNVLYTSTRGNDVLSIFDVSEGQAKRLQSISTKGATPRNFVLTKDGKYLIVANQDSHEISVYTLDDNGIPHFSFKGHVWSPVCLVEGA